MIKSGKCEKKRMGDIVDVLRTEEKRRYIRHPVNFPLSYKTVSGAPDAADANKATTVNISLGGLMFTARHPVKKRATVLIKMPFHDKMFNIRGKVTRCDKCHDSNLYNIGVSFFRITDAFKTKLIEQLYLISEFRNLWSIQLGKEVTLEVASKEWIKRYSKRFQRLYW